MDSNKKLTLEERIDLHRRMAEAYYDGYVRQEVQEGAKYAEWKFTDDAVGLWPYFTGDQVLPLAGFEVDFASSDDIWAQAAAMEAKAYSLSFPDWKPAEFKSYPSDIGFVMRTRWEGHTKDATKSDGTKIKDGTKMGFFSYGFIDTNDQGEITRWETHVNEEFGSFLEVAIGVRGPFKGSEYVEALTRRLEKAGVEI